MSDRRLLLSQVLDKGDAPLALYKYLAKKWAIPKSPQEFTASRSLRLNMDYATGAVSDTGFPVLEALGILVSRGAEGLDKLFLIAVNEDDLISVLHSLFQVGESDYEDGTGELFAICGKITSNGLPAIVRLKAIHFSANSSSTRSGWRCVGRPPRRPPWRCSPSICERGGKSAAETFLSLRACCMSAEPCLCS